MKPTQALAALKRDLAAHADPAKAEHHLAFFKTAPGEYGHGDRFIGVTVPQTRAIVRKYAPHLTQTDIENLLQSPVHEHRFAALILHNTHYARQAAARADLIALYLRNTHRINNWDLVDCSAPYTLGHWLHENPDEKLRHKLAASKLLWEQRIAVLSTFYSIRQNDHAPILALSEKLRKHPHDLMHKAIGWMLRESAKRGNQAAVEKFLRKHKNELPRTLLRYAIERFPKKLRTELLAKTEE